MLLKLNKMNGILVLKNITNKNFPNNLIKNNYYQIKKYKLI